MLHMMRSMMDLLREGVFYNRSVMFDHRDTRDELLEQHRAINAALQARDAAGAQAAVEAHLTFVRGAVRDHGEARRHEETARRRLARVLDG
jgi:GntR family transcriptional repressor for pyruvate dehydrogenase complex